MAHKRTHQAFFSKLKNLDFIEMSKTQKPILEVKDLTITMGKQKIIEKLSFNLDKGEILTILGPNGVGKSLLIKSLLGLIPYTGKIKWNKKIRFGYLPQGLTQLSLKNLPLSIYEFLSLKTENEKRISKLFKELKVDYSEIKDKKIGSLSGGQFQKVLFVWSMLSKPNVLILDEPNSNMDIVSQERMYKKLHQLSQKQKVTIILVTHDLNIIYKYSTSVLCLSHRFYCSLPHPKNIDIKLFDKVYEKPVRIYNHDLHR